MAAGSHSGGGRRRTRVRAAHSRGPARGLGKLAPPAQRRGSGSSSSSSSSSSSRRRRRRRHPLLARPRRRRVLRQRQRRRLTAPPVARSRSGARILSGRRGAHRRRRVSRVISQGHTPARDPRRRHRRPRLAGQLRPYPSPRGAYPSPRGQRPTLWSERPLRTGSRRAGRRALLRRRAAPARRGRRCGRARSFSG